MLLRKEDIYLDLDFKNKKSAIKGVGEIMLEKGFIKKPYIKSMIRRDKEDSVAIGNGLAIAHSTNEGMKDIVKPGMILIKLKNPINWDGETIKFIVGLALPGNQQIDTLQSLAISFSNLKNVEQLYNHAKTVDDIMEFLEENEE